MTKFERKMLIKAMKCFTRDKDENGSDGWEEGMDTLDNLLILDSSKRRVKKIKKGEACQE